MLDKSQVSSLASAGRVRTAATVGDPSLGPFKNLPGTWANKPNLPGRGWNMIALPFATEPDSRLNYRLLLNQYNETLKFSIVDRGVPNRGITTNGTTQQTDQFVVTLDYEQGVTQIAGEDFPESGVAGGNDLAIHHEPGLWLHMTNETTRDLDIGRLATVPHGDSVLALGRSAAIDGAPDVPEINGLPIGATRDIDHPYLAPYKHFRDNPFKNLFDPTAPNDLLRQANAGVDIVRTTVLEVDTKIASGGIANIPFVVRQADAAAMKSTFWIQELVDQKGEPKLRLQYSQVVILEFFPRFDGSPGRVHWPHVSINTMEKISDEILTDAQLAAL